MAAASTIPAAKAALLTALQARAGLTGVDVRWGLPAQTPDVTERVYVGDADNIDREWAALGGQRVNEDYVLQVIVETFQFGDDQRATEERFWVLVNEVEQALRGDLRLAGTVREAGLDGVTDQKVGPTDEGWGATGVVRIRCQARI
jgi:hypothetical protein